MGTSLSTNKRKASKPAKNDILPISCNFGFALSAYIKTPTRAINKLK
jgi:hypothetical protein